MLHSEVLGRLFPVELGGMHDDDVTVDGAALDRAQELIDAFLVEMFPGTAVLLLDRWEALYEIVPAEGATIAERQAAVQARHLRKGDIKKPFFVLLAADMGYTIRIDDYTPSMADWLCAGDEVIEEPWDYFSAGLGMAGDYLAQENVVTPWIWKVVVLASPPTPPSPSLETVLNDLKPAHFQLNYEYL